MPIMVDPQPSELETLRDALIDIGQAVGLPGGRVDMVVHEVRSLAKFTADVARATGLDDADVGVLASEVAVNAIALKRVREMLGVTSTRTDDLVAAIDRLQSSSVEIRDLRDALGYIRAVLGLDRSTPPSDVADAVESLVGRTNDRQPASPSAFMLVGTPSSGLESIDVRTVTRAWSQRDTLDIWRGTAVPQSVPAAYIERPCGTLVLCCDTNEEAAGIVERIHAARVACCR